MCVESAFFFSKSLSVTSRSLIREMRVCYLKSKWSVSLSWNSSKHVLAKKTCQVAEVLKTVHNSMFVIIARS